MECRITSTAQKTNAAYTLLEMSVAMGLGMVILAALLMASVFSARSFAALQNYRDMESKSRITLDKLSQDIRQTDYLSNYTTTNLAFQTTDPTTSNKYILNYTYSTNALTLTRLYGTNSTIVMSNCTYFHFDLFQRNPTQTNGGDLVTLISTNSASYVKAIDFTWICQEQIYGQTYSSEDVQSARVVIRKD
jgi:hypothetical protein